MAHKLVNGQLSGAVTVLPRVSGIKYRISSINIYVCNNAATDNQGAYVDVPMEDGNRRFYCQALALTANRQILQISNLDIETVSGGAVTGNFSGNAAPDSANYIIQYDEVQA